MTITLKFQNNKEKKEKTAAHWQPDRILKRTKKKSISKVQQYRNVLKYLDTQRQQTFHLFKMLNQLSLCVPKFGHTTA